MRFVDKRHEIEAWIDYADDKGNALPEHRVASKMNQHTGFETMKAYLEMEEGKTFRIHVRVHEPCPRKYSYRLGLFVDGRDFDAFALQDSRVDRSNHITLDKVYSMQGNQRMAGDLQFTPLDRTSVESEVELRGEELDNLCSIVIQIIRGNSKPSDKSMWTPNLKEVKLGKVHADQFQSGSTVSALKLKKDNSNQMPLTFLAKPGKSKVCSFVWKYYTRDMLIHKGYVSDNYTVSTAPAGVPLAEQADEQGESARGKRGHVEDTDSDEEDELDYDDDDDEMDEDNGDHHRHNDNEEDEEDQDSDDNKPGPSTKSTKNKKARNSGANEQYYDSDEEENDQEIEDEDHEAWAANSGDAEMRED